jgi:hypothetical protein
MYTDTITLFNRKESRLGDTWYPSVLRNVQINIDKAAILAKYGASATDNAILNIRYIQEGESKMVGGKEWIPPKMWEALDDPASRVTFTDGARFDFFWLGEWLDEQPISDADYIAYTDFYTYMNSTQDYVFAITAVGGPYSVIPHFEIMGK